MSEITFSFGKNWQAYLRAADDEAVGLAQADVLHWLGRGAIEGRSVLDVGSGSGIHSLAFWQLGAESIHSLDVDSASVEATRSVWTEAGRPANWQVLEASILDAGLPGRLKPDGYEIVYSWGVLHHTGAMWEALGKTLGLVAEGGRLWIGLYASGPRYEQILALKRSYNAGGSSKRWLLERRLILRSILRQGANSSRALLRLDFKHLTNPLRWNRRVGRGMDTYHDIVDWLGGLPYEEADHNEVISFVRPLGFVLDRLEPAAEGGITIYLFSHHPELVQTGRQPQLGAMD